MPADLEAVVLSSLEKPVDRQPRDARALRAPLPARADAGGPTLRAGLAADERKLRELGYDARWLLVDRARPPSRWRRPKLKAETFDCILIGAGHPHRRPTRT